MDPQGLSYGRTPFEQIQAHIEFEPGEYRFVKKDGEDWPVVICDEEIVQKYCEGKLRPEEARQADGTWGKQFQAGGSRAGQKCYPALIPGSLKFCWPGWRALEPFDVDMGKAIRDTTTNRQLAVAWDEAIKAEEERKRIGYWKGKLAAKESGCPDGNEVDNRKRKGTPKMKFPRGYAREEVDDDEGANLFLPRCGDSVPRIKHEFNDPTPLENIDASYEGTCPPSPWLGTASSKRRKVDMNGRSSSQMPPARKDQNPASNSASTPLSSFQSTRSQSPTMDRENNQTKVIIYVGNPHQKLRANRSALEASRVLSDLAVYHPKDGWYVMAPMLSGLALVEFIPIAQYLVRGEYEPNILDEGTEWVRLERDLTDAQRSQEVIRCGKIYSTARNLELPGLQNLALRKLKALASDRPHQPFAILCVVEVALNAGDESLRQYLAHYLARNFWDIMLAETVKFANIMQNEKELAHGVFHSMSNFAGLKLEDVKVEEKSRVKDEELERDALSALSAEPSEMVLRVDNAEEGQTP